MTKFRQMGALAIEFARDFGGEYAFLDLHDDAPQSTRRMVGPLKGSAGPGVEDVVAVWTAVVGNPAFRVPAARAKAILLAATGAAQPFGSDKVQQFLEISIFSSSVCC